MMRLLAIVSLVVMLQLTTVAAWTDFCTRKMNQFDRHVYECSQRYCVTGDCNMATIPFFNKGLRKQTGMFRVTQSPVKKIFNTTFANYVNLRFLYLDNNDIRSFQSGAFVDQTNLQFLSIRDNSIISIPNGLFSHLKSLFFLDLSGNAIWGLASPAFVGLGALRYMNLADNPIGPIQCGFWNGLDSLNFLNMSRAPSQCAIAQTAATDTEIQCNCQYAGNYHRVSHCDQAGCAAGVRKIKNLRQRAEATEITGGWHWVQESLLRWNNNWHSGGAQFRRKKNKGEVDLTDGVLNSRDGVDATEMDNGGITLTVSLCVGALIVVAVGAVGIRYRHKASRKARGEKNTSTGSSTMTSDVSKITDDNYDAR